MRVANAPGSWLPGLGTPAASAVRNREHLRRFGL